MAYTFLRQNASVNEQIAKELVKRKYMNKCIPFGYINLWTRYISACTCYLFYNFLHKTRSLYLQVQIVAALKLLHQFLQDLSPSILISHYLCRSHLVEKKNIILCITILGVVKMVHASKKRKLFTF